MAVSCPNCKNDRYWNLVNAKTWFTLFFIPVIPYENNSYLLCPVCERGLQLHGEKKEQAVLLNNTTRAYLNKEITEEQYQAALAQTRLLS